MNVWSRGLGTMSLDLALDKATLGTKDADNPDGHRFVFKGIIESMWWEYEASLTADDMLGFVRVLSTPRVASLLARSYGFRLQVRFLAKLVAVGIRFLRLRMAGGAA